MITNRKKEHWTVALAKVRHQHELTQKQMAKIIGVSEKTIYRWESNPESKLNIRTCEIICRKFDLSFSDFVEGRVVLANRKHNYKVNFIISTIILILLLSVALFVRLYSKDTIQFEAITIIFPKRNIIKLQNYLFYASALGVLTSIIISKVYPYKLHGINVINPSKKD